MNIKASLTRISLFAFGLILLSLVLIWVMDQMGGIQSAKAEDCTVLYDYATQDYHCVAEDAEGVEEGADEVKAEEGSSKLPIQGIRSDLNH